MAYKFNLKNNPELAVERKRTANRAYYARNREKILAKHAEWRQQNPGYDAQFMRDKRELQQTYFNLDTKPILEVLHPIDKKDEKWQKK